MFGLCLAGRKAKFREWASTRTISLQLRRDTSAQQGAGTVAIGKQRMKHNMVWRGALANCASHTAGIFAFKVALEEVIAIVPLRRMPTDSGKSGQLAHCDCSTRILLCCRKGVCVLVSLLGPSPAPQIDYSSASDYTHREWA